MKNGAIFGQGLFYGDFGVPEEGVGIDLADLALAEAGVGVEDGLLLIGVDLFALASEGFLHGLEQRASVDELHLAFARGFLAVVEDPDVGGDAGVKEEGIGQLHDALQPVVLDDPPADLRLPASGVAGEQRGAVEHNADARSFVFHLGDHMLKEQQGAVGCAGRACGKPAVGILRFAAHELFLALPGYAEGRIGDHIIELLAGEPVFAQR